MYKNLVLLITFASKFFKTRIVYLQILILLNSILQILSILSFAPLIIFLNDPSKIFEYNLIFLENFNEKNIFFYLISLIVLLFIISNIFNVIVSNTSLKLGQKIGISLNYKIYSYLINKNYSYHSKTNSAEIISKITLETARVVNSILIPLLLINSRIIIASTILIGMLIINFKISLTVFIFIIISYVLIFLIQRKKLTKNSHLISQNNRIRQKTIAESIGNMRETILFKSQNLFLKIFDRANKDIGMSVASNQFLSTIPRHLIEIVAFTLLMIIIFFLKNQNLLNDYLPLIGIYLVAAYKLLPSIQNIASSYASIKGNYSALENIIPEINFILLNIFEDIETRNYKNNAQKFDFKNLKLENFNFSYDDKKKIFVDTNFKISRGEVIGIMGETGIGKSSLIDLICGLVDPSSGDIMINDKILDDRTKKNLIDIISLVPQRINLIDDTIKNNIIFPNLDQNFLNLEKKLNYLKTICDLEYIDDMKMNWESLVGENGSKLSGGQIQRIGIARALFKDPQILIMDEATSALDENTQSKILNNILKISTNLSIIIISHNKSVLERCNKIYEIKDFKINLKNKQIN